MLKPGDTFDRYAVEAPIGSGGMGAVYRARDTRLDRRVALKVIADGATRTAESDARFIREARAAAALEHPNIVLVFDAGEHEGSPYIVMELVAGKTLRELLGDATVDATTRVAWLTDVAKALAAAHRRGLVHRDVKPENVMVREDGVVKVLDFGIARASSSGAVDAHAPTQAQALPALTREGAQIGTPIYMAPEQIRGLALDGRTDQFAWGVLAFELLAGKLPWSGVEPLAVVASILTDDVSADDLSAAGASPAVAAVVCKALSKKPADRFASMDDLLRALAPDALPVSVPPTSAPVAKPVSIPPNAPAPARGAELQRYSTAEVKEILSRAIERQEAARSDTRLGFDDLVAAASEVGVSPEVLREATRELRAPGSQRAPAAPSVASERDIWLRSQRNRFFRHFGVWSLVSVALLFNGIAEGHVGDHMKAILFWGVFVGWHALRTFLWSEDEWQKARENRIEYDRKHPSPVAAKASPGIDEGAELLLRTGALRRQRITSNEAPPVRIRDTNGELRAEREAIAEEAAEHAPAIARKRS